MNAVRKAILFLGALAILFSVPMTAAVENDDIQTPAAVTFSLAPSASSPKARNRVQARVLSQATLLVTLCPVSTHHGAERVSNLAFRDCRSNLRSLSLLRC
jgi:hypothetical protein